MRGMGRTAVIALVALAALASACGGPPPEQPRTYELVGQILTVGPDRRGVVVKHDDIPGFMPAMTMTYLVKDPVVLDGRVAGDLVKATLKVSGGEAWLTEITKTGEAPLPADAPEKVPVAAGVHLLSPGDAAPDTALTDQDGASLSLARWSGKAVAVTFIYTQCPLPQFCPLMDRRFAEVQSMVAADPALRGRVRLLSVSFDPRNDQPLQLRAHAAKLSADPAVWRFATAPEDEVDRFAAAFGVNVIRESDGTITHNLRTAVIDTEGHVTALHDGNTWTAAELVSELKQTLGQGR